MNASRLPELKQNARKVVRRASKPGGALEEGVFTMHLARKEISKLMGLGDDGLDDTEWKQVVKAEVTRFLVSTEQA